MSLLTFNMIGFKFRVIEHIKNNEKLNNEFNLIFTKKIMVYLKLERVNTYAQEKLIVIIGFYYNLY